MAIAMSQEELAYLLRLQGKQAMRGATLDLAPNDENLEKALLGAAERSLRSRGWIVVSDDTFSIEQTILGMVGFVLNAPYAIAVRRTPTGGQSHAITYHISNALQVSHTGREGVHVFDVLSGSPARAVLDTMHGGAYVTDTARETMSGIAARVLVAAAAVAQDASLSDDAALTVLTESGVEATQAATLLRFYRDEWLATVVIGVWSPGEEGADYSSLGFIQSRGGWWVMFPSSDAPIIDLRPITSTDLTTLIDETIHKTLATR